MDASEPASYDAASRDADVGAPAPDLATAMINGLREHGILIGAAGRFGNILKIRPPLCVTKDDADELVGRMEDVLADIGRE